MARVPTVAGNSVALKPMTDAKFKAADFDTPGAGAGMQTFGKTGVQAANDLEQIDATYDEAAAKKLYNQAVERTRAMLWTGDNAYYRKEGFDATNARPVVEQSFGKLRAELLGQATTERQKSMFGAAFDRLHGQEAEGIARYEVGELKKEETRQSAARMSNFRDDAVRFAGDPVRFGENMQGGLIELRNQADRNGWAPEVLKRSEAEFVSNAHAAIVKGRLATDIDGAKDWLDTHRGELTVQDAQELDGALARPLQEREAFTDADAVLGLSSAPTGPGAVGDTTSSGQLFASIIQLEGGTDRNGKFRTSPKGAIGPAQVMPGTAPEAARLAGLEWSDTKYRTDPAYNLALGQAYYQKQLRDFGDPALAAAAYNAGPGAVRKALAKGGDWQDHIPSETKKYVKGFRSLTNDPAVRQAPQRHDLTELLARTDVLAERQGWSFERRERAKAEIEQRVNRDERLLNRQQAQAADEAWDTVATMGAGFRSLSQVPPDVLGRMDGRARMQFEGIAAANSKPEPIETNYAAYTQLSDMYARDPKSFAALNPASFRAKLEDGDFEQVMTWRRDALKAGNNPDPKQVTVARVRTASAAMLEAAGLSTTGMPTKKPADLLARQNVERRRYAFEKAMLGDIAIWQQANGGKVADDATLQAMADRRLLQVVPAGAEEPVFQFEARGPGRVRMPQRDIDRIRTVGRQILGRDPSEQEIVQAYLTEARGGR